MWWGWVVGDLLFSAGVESLGRWMCLLGEWHGVGGPGEILCDVHPRNLVLLTLSTVELSMVSGGGQWVPPPEVQHSLLCLLHIEGQIVSATTIQPAVPLPLCSAFHRCCWWDLPLLCHQQTWWCGWSWTWQCSRGQQREEQRAEHTALWGTCAQCGSARGVVADMDWLRSSG